MANFLIAYNSSAMNPSLVIPTDETETLSYNVRNVGVDGIVLESRLSLSEEHEYQIIPCFSSIYAGCRGYQAQACQGAANEEETHNVTLASIGECPVSENEQQK